jgi:uncharacterized membrane protein YkgB
MLLKQTKMKFPKIASIEINQLPTDSSILTPQEKYIFDTIFLPEVNEFEKSSQQHELMQQKLSSQNQQIASHPKHEGKKCHSFGKKFIISILLTAIIIIFAISPLPSVVRTSTASPMIISVIIFALFAISFLFLQPYIAI